MLLLTLFLRLGWIKLQWVQGLSDFLVANMGFFLVPPGVALMLYFDVIAAEFWPSVIATIVSTARVLVVTGWVHPVSYTHLDVYKRQARCYGEIATLPTTQTRRMPPFRKM